MKYPKAKISKFSERDGYYVWLTISTYLSNNNKVFDFFNENGDHEEKVKQIIFATEELAQEALDKFNNPMNKTRNYPALKQEGIDKNLCPKGYIYIGMGNDENPLKNDWDRSDICVIEGDGSIDSTAWSGDTDWQYCVRESVWNKKFPAAKKPITLDEIKSQYEDAKKLIGKKIKRINSCSEHDNVKFTVSNVSLNLDFANFPNPGPRSKEFFDKFGYIIYLSGRNELYPDLHAIFSDEYFKVVKDVEVVLNSSYTAFISDSGIKVGCQTFPLDIIEKLVAAKKELA